MNRHDTYVRMYIHTYLIHTYMHTYVHPDIYTYIHTYIHTCINTYIHTYTCMHTHQHLLFQYFITMLRLMASVVKERNRAAWLVIMNRSDECKALAQLKLLRKTILGCLAEHYLHVSHNITWMFERTLLACLEGHYLHVSHNITCMFGRTLG
jgi:hypothetical protein